jgi:hypothetical protein
MRFIFFLFFLLGSFENKLSAWLIINKQARDKGGLGWVGG